MTSKTLLDELIRAQNEGYLDSLLAQAPVDRDLIEVLKKEVDFHIRSDARRALQLAELAVRLAQCLDDAVASAVAYRSNAVALYSLGRFGEAIDLWTAALAAYRLQDMTSEMAAVQRSMVDALMYVGRYDDSIKLASEVRVTLEGLGDAIGLARLDTNLGNVFHRMDRNQEALAYYERAMSAFQAAGDIFGIALTSFNAANIHSNLHSFDKAQERYELAERLYREKGMDLAAAQARYSLGYLHFLTGSYHQSIRTLERVRGDFDRLGDTRAAALCLLDLAEIYLQMNVLDDAAALASRAYRGFVALEMRYESGRALIHRGLAQLGLLRFSEAEASLVAARGLFAAEGNNFYLGMTAAYRSELELRRGAPALALERIAEARSIFERNDLGVKLCHARLIEAKALHANGAHELAFGIAADILDDLKRLPAPWLEQQARELIGDLRMQSQDREGAYAEYLAAAESIEERRGHIRVEEFRSAFFSDKLRVYEKLIHLCLGYGTAQKDAEAFYFLESRRARTMVDLMTSGRDPWPAAESPDSDLQTWRRLRAELHWLYRQLNDAEERREDRTHRIESDLAAQIRSREAELTEVWRRAERADPTFAHLDSPSGISVVELRAALLQGDSLIEYYAHEDRLMAFVVDDRDLRVVRLSASLHEVRERIEELKFFLEKFQYGAAYVAEHGDLLLACMNDSLRWLHETLFAPISSLVVGRNLVIVPFDVLHNVPFHALFDGHSYLIDQHEISYAPSARIHALCRFRSAGACTSISVLGAPDEFAPRIQQEVDAIRGVFPDARCFVGEAATREALVASLQRDDILHIASHAVFRQDNPMFSAFKLADRWVDAYDVSRLRMSSRMVTLSGCSTGAGRVYAGDEMVGLIRGFMKAGVSTLVVTLWQVDDSAAATIMGSFYERLRRGGSMRGALREAALELKRRLPNPYYWAPFVLIGHK